MRVLRRLGSDTTANVAIIFALAMFPVVAVSGMSIDYTLAGRRQVQLNAAADAAALMTTSPSGMALTATAAQQAATAMFLAQAGKVVGVTVQSPNIVVQDTTNPNGSTTRHTTVPFTATSQNAFSALLRMATINLAGTSAVSSSTAPNIDFYLLLDTSPSMGIPSTPSGINTMVSKTQAQGGCAFACHEANPTAKNNAGVSDNAGNPNGWDNYAYAHSLNLTLRMDLVNQATANLIQTAAQTEAVNKAAYRVATYTFDQAFKTITSLTSNLSQAQSDAASKILLQEVYDKKHLTPSTDNSSEDTQLDSALSSITSVPNPGKGTNVNGDTPQEVLFLVTDGVIDEAYPNYGPLDNTDSGDRTITTVGHQRDYCTPLKARGIRIAVLSLTYYPLPNDSFYSTYVAPIQSQISPALQSCASPGLFFEVESGGDINGALQALFVKAVGSSHLTQ